jgi:hypothetical protein
MGIITSTLELKSKENSYILSVDGKPTFASGIKILNP